MVQTTDVTATKTLLAAKTGKPPPPYHGKYPQAKPTPAHPRSTTHRDKDDRRGYPSSHNHSSCKPRTTKYRLPREINLRTAKCHARGTRPAAAKLI